MFLVSENILNKIAVILAVFFLILGGFYFGYKFKSSHNMAQASGFVTDSRVATADYSNVITAPMSEMAFPDKDGECVEPYLIKGKFDGSDKKYYTTNNKFYKRVKPQICFMKEEDVTKYGFIKQ